MRQYLPLILTLVIGPLIGAAVMYWNSRTRVGEAGDVASIKERQAPIEALRLELLARKDEVTQTRQQFFQFMQSHTEKNDAQTRALLELAAECRAQTDALKSHMTASSERARNIFDKLTDVKEKIAQIQGHLGAA